MVTLVLVLSAVIETGTRTVIATVVCTSRTGTSTSTTGSNNRVFSIHVVCERKSTGGC